MSSSLCIQSTSFPWGRRLSIYDDLTISWRTYIVASDRVPRETRNPSSPSLPALSYSSTNGVLVNPFLVILNADIEFRRYNRIQTAPPPLNPDVVQLMTRTSALVSLLYWKPERSDTVGAGVRKLAVEHRRQNQPKPRPDHHDFIEIDTKMGKLVSKGEEHDPMFQQQRRG